MKDGELFVWIVAALAVLALVAYRPAPDRNGGGAAGRSRCLTADEKEWEEAYTPMFSGGYVEGDFTAACKDRPRPHPHEMPLQALSR